MNNNKKYELLLEICEFYEYDVLEENEKIICHYNKEYHFEYSNIDEALCDWYDTLIETNHNHECYSDTNQYTTWGKEEIDFIRDILKDSEDKNKIKKGEVNNMSALQIKYDLDLKYKGTEFVGILECHKIECKGIPCVKDDRLELVNVLYSQKGEENYIVKFIEINNVIYSISDMKYWYGISSEELFEQIDCLINKQEIPNSYIKVSDKFYKVERLEDILNIEAEGEIAECFIENDSLLFDVVYKYLGKDIKSLIEDLDTLISYVNLDEDALLALLKENPNIIYWLNYVDVYCYDTTDKEEAYRIHLEEEEEIPYRALDYMDVLSYVEEELDLKTIITSNSTVLYC